MVSGRTCPSVSGRNICSRPESVDRTPNTRDGSGFHTNAYIIICIFITIHIKTRQHSKIAYACIFNQNWSGIWIRICGLIWIGIPVSAVSLPKCNGFIPLSATVIYRVAWKVTGDFTSNKKNLRKRSLFRNAKEVEERSGRNSLLWVTRQMYRHTLRSRTAILLCLRP